MLKIGDKVWKSGGSWETAKLVTLKDEFEVGLAEQFWGSLYFATAREAAMETDRAHGAYGSYLNTVFSR